MGICRKMLAFDLLVKWVSRRGRFTVSLSALMGSEMLDVSL